MRAKRKAALLAGLAIFVLLAGCLVALLVPRLEAVLAAASFVGYVACARRALILFRADEVVFASDGSGARERAAREAVRAGLAAGTIGSAVLGRAAANRRTSAGLPALRRRAAFPRALDRAAHPRTR